MFLILGNFLSARAQLPAITNISPGTVCQGETVTITGTDFTGATSVKSGNNDATNFTVKSATSITASFSNVVTNGTVTVTTPGGTSTNAVTLTILPVPVPVLTDLGSVDAPFTNCNGNSTYQLNVANSSVTNGTGNSYQINWGDNTASFIQTDWSPGAQTAHTYTAQGYYNITVTITPQNGCTRSVTYRFYNGVNPLASFTTTSSTTGLCTPASVEFQIGNWFNNSAGTSYQVNFGDGSPNVTLQNPLNATNTVRLLSHAYTTSSCPNVDFTATLEAINGCFTTTYALNQIIIRRKPEADFTIQPIPSCISSPVCFTNQTTNGYSGNACNTTSTFSWTFGDGTTSTAQTPICHSYTTAGTYDVTLTASNATCGSSTKTKQVIVLPTSPPPVVSATPVVYCQGKPAVPLTATGTGLLWYTSANGGTGNPVAPTPSTNTPGTTTWYVSQTLVNECESPRVPVSVTVTALPGAPAVTTPVQLCQNQAASPLTASGTGLLWYTSALGAIGSPIPPTPSTTTIGSTTWYVTQTTNGCEGPRASIIVTVNALAVAPIVTSPITYCQNQLPVPLTAPGSGLLWYTVATGGAGSSIPPTPSTGTAGTSIYYVSQVTGCGEGPRASITVNVNPGPSASISYNPTILCNAVNAPPAAPDLPVAVIQTGTPGGRYSISPATGLPIDASTGAISPAGATPGTYTIKYSVTGTGGCSNFTTTTTVTISGSPTAAITYPALCTADAATPVNLTGIRGGIFTSTVGLSIDPSTGTITPATSLPGIYSVTYTISPSSPCPGFVTTTSVTVTQAPSASISYSPAILCNVNAPESPNPPVAVTQTGSSGGRYSISPAGLPINASTGAISPSGATAGTYIITYSVTGTGGCSNFTTTTTVTVSGSPTAAIIYPAICSADAAIPVNLTGTRGGSFTSSTGLTINASTGTITPATSLPGTYTVTYTISPSSPCPGFVTTASVTITQAPSAAISYSPAILCNVKDAPPTAVNPPITVTQTGSPGGSYSISPAGLPINSATGEISPSEATAGTYTITYSITGTGGCSNFAATTTVTINSTPTAAINYPGSPYCRGITIPQPVSFSGTPGGTYHSGQGLSINATTGAIDPASSQPGTYIVTYTITPSSPCPGYIATTGVEIDESPILTFPTAIQSICSGGTALFPPSSTVPNTMYTWSVVGPLPANVAGVTSGTSSGPDPSIILSFTNTGPIGQSLLIRVIPINPSSNPCPGAPYDLTLMVNPVPAAPVPGTIDFCMGDPATALKVNPEPGTTIKWYDNNLVLLSAAPVISTTVPAQFTYYVSQSNSNRCESPKSRIIAIVHPTAKIVSSSFTNPVTCGIPSGSIVLNVLDLNNNPIPDLPVLVHYDKFQTAYSIPESTDASGKITIPLVAGTYSGIFVETSGCLSQKIPDIFILKDPNPPAQPVAGYNPPICSETPLNLTALSPTSPQAGAIDYVWAGPAFGSSPDTVSDTFISFPSAAISDAGTYVVYAMQNNCISSPANFQVVIKQSPSKPLIVTRNPLCVGDALSLQAYSSIPGPDTQLDYLWTGPGAGFPTNTANAGINKVKIEDAGIYSITVNSPQTGCSSTTDTLIRIGDYPVVKFSKDTLTLPTGFLLNLVPAIINQADPGILPIAKYEWTPTQDLTCNDTICSSPVATIKNDICYSVKATNSYGCSGSDVVCVKVFCQSSQIFIPNAFTPKGDIPGNRILTVRASGISSVRSFRVFNRWGKIVFERNNFPPNSPDFGWDGRVNGNPADPGVYVYTVEVVCENGIPYTFKGNVTLL